MQNYHLKINYWRLLMFAFIIAWIEVVLFFFFAYKYEGTRVSNEWLFIIIAYPYYLLSGISFRQNQLCCILGIIIGVVINSLLIEILLSTSLTYFRKKSTKIQN